MLNVFTLANGRLFQEEIENAAALADVAPIWVDLEAPTLEEKLWIAERFGVTIPEDIVAEDLEESARFYEEDNGELHIRSDFLIEGDPEREDRARATCASPSSCTTTCCFRCTPKTCRCFGCCACGRGASRH